MAERAALLEVEGLKKHFVIGGGMLGRPARTLRAVDGLSLRIGAGETFGLVGESGCGKSTAGKSIVRLIEPTAGSVRLGGAEITSLGARAMREQRRHMQIIFQDPYASLNPKMSAASIVGEPLRNYGLYSERERGERVAGLFARVGLRADQMARYPHEFSGGQRQRLGIARALALAPRLVVCDEPVSALDVSVQAQVINLMVRLQQELGLSYLFIAHDLAVVRHISDRVGVMYLGRLVEEGPTRAIFGAAAHPYTRMLLASVPRAGAGSRRGRAAAVRSEPPSPLSPPSGCHFHPRCPEVMARCRVDVPETRVVGVGHRAACHLVGGGSGDSAGAVLG